MTEDSAVHATASSAQLREMRAELEEVRQELQAVKQVQIAQWRSEEGHAESKSSHDSNFIEILIPPDCYPGDACIVEVDEVEFEMVVPDGCAPGEVIYMDLRDGTGPGPSYPASELSSKKRSGSRPASGVKKKILQELAAEQLIAALGDSQGEAEIVEVAEEDTRHGSSESHDSDLIGIMFPFDCHAGDACIVEVDGFEFEIVVPEGCSPGEVIYMDLREGWGTPLAADELSSKRRSSSRPASGVKKKILQELAAEQLRALEASAATERSGLEELAAEQLRALEASRAEQLQALEASRAEQLQALEASRAEQLQALEASAASERTGLEELAAQQLRALEASAASERSGLQVLAAEQLRALEASAAAATSASASLLASEKSVQLEAVEDIRALKDDIQRLKEEQARLLGQLQHTVKQNERNDAKEKMAKEVASLRREVRKLKQAMREPQPSIVNLLGAQAAEVPILDMHFKLEGELSTFDEADFTNSLAHTLGVDQSLIQIRLSPGSVIVDASISVSDGAVLQRAEEVLKMGKDELSYALGSTVLEPPRFVLMAQSPQLGKEKSLSNETPRSSGVDVVDVTIPDGIYAGDVFYAEVNGVEFKVVVPENCGPGKVIEMEVPSSLTQEGIGPVTSRSSSYEAQDPLPDIVEPDVVEVVIPPGATAAGGFIATLHGKDYEISVPEGGQEGDAIEIDLAGLSQPSSRGSQASKIYEVVVPESLKAGDLFIAQLAGKEYEIPVPSSCQGGDVIEVDASGLSEPPSSASQDPRTFSVVIPPTLCANDSFTIMVEGKEFEIVVPEDKQAGDEIVVEFAGLTPLSSGRKASLKDLEDEDESDTQVGSEGPVTLQGEAPVEAAVVEAVQEKPQPLSQPSAALPRTGSDQGERSAEPLASPATDSADQQLLTPKDSADQQLPTPKDDQQLLTPKASEEVGHEVRDALVENACMAAEEEAVLQHLEYLKRREIEEAERLRRDEEEREAARIASEKAAEEAERQRIEDLKRKEIEEAERAAREEAARENACMAAEEEDERQRLEYLERQAREEAERLRREEEEREAARIAAEKAAEEAERQRIEDLKRQALEEAERAAREEEARIKREEAEIKGKVVVSVTVVNDETEELMAKASLRLGCKVLELAQVCIREARLSVTPAIFTEPKPEPRMVRGKMELRERLALNSDYTLLEAGIENNAVLRAKISPAVITASKDCTARIWNAETGKCELVLEGHTEAVCSACISPDCRYVATSSEDGSSRLWYVDSGRCARVLLDHKEAVYFATFSPDSKQVVTASEDATAKIWVVKTGICKLTLEGHHFAVLWATFSPDGRSVTTTSSDGTLKIWNAKTGVCDRTLLGQKPVYLASFASDGTTFVTASGDATAKICDLMTGDAKIVLTGHESLVLGASYAPSCPQPESHQKDDAG